MSPEQKQLEQIQEHLAQRKAEARPLPSTEIYVAHVDFLLSLVKSQEAGVTTELYQVATKVLRWLYATMSPKTGDKSLLKVKQFEIHKELEQAILKAHATRVNADIAATSMRSACVEKVKAMRGEWLSKVSEEWGDRPDLSFDAAKRVAAADKIINELESLSIEKPKE